MKNKHKQTYVSNENENNENLMVDFYMITSATYKLDTQFTNTCIQQLSCSLGCPQSTTNQNTCNNFDF